MKIAFITSHINKSLQWLWFAEELQKRNIEQVHIIINDFFPLLYDDLVQIGVKVYFLKHKHFFSHFINLYKTIKILKKHQVEIVHTSLPFGNLIGQIAAMLLNIKKRVTTCENASWAFDFKSKKQYLVDLCTYKLANKIIVTCKPAREFLENKWKIDKQKLVTIYQALKKEEYEKIDPERIERIKQLLKIKENDLIIGVIARLEFWKGHSYIIDAVKQIVKQYSSVKLFIFGSKGSAYQQIRNQIKKLNLQDHVFYIGFVDDPIALYQLLDIQIHVPVNKHVETFGLSIIEGMISKVPQILTRSGIAFETARHLKNAYVVDYCNSKQIAEGVKRMIEEPLLRQNIAAQAKQDAAKLFSLETKVNKHLQLYNNLQGGFAKPKWHQKKLPQRHKGSKVH